MFFTSILLDYYLINYEHPVYYLTVAENSAVGASLLKVTAADRDSGVNGVVSYRVESVPSEPEAENLVHVDPKTGVISAKVGFDRESLPRIVFDVVATDGGGDTPRSGRTRVHRNWRVELEVHF